MKRPALRNQINQMALSDQQLRYQRAQASNKEERRKVDQQIFAADKANLDSAKSILKRYGWPGLNDIGKDGQNNLWLIVQHADGDVLFQQKALDAMRKLIVTKQLKTYDYFNEASTIASGMSTRDNYEAAVLFAKIAAADTNEQYASIPLDFLQLVYLSRELSKKQAMGEPAFKILYQQGRWKEMMGKLR